jgi:hypothetical protein
MNTLTSALQSHHRGSGELRVDSLVTLPWSAHEPGTWTRDPKDIQGAYMTDIPYSTIPGPSNLEPEHPELTVKYPQNIRSTLPFGEKSNPNYCRAFLTPIVLTNFAPPKT